MKIAVISPETLPIPPIKGGAIETWIYETGRGLSRNGCKIYSLGIGDPSLPKKEIDDNKITYLRFTPGFLSKLFLCSYRLPFKQPNSTLYYFPFSLWCILHLKRIKPDIIHVHSRPQFAFFISLFCTNAKIILHIHNLGILDFNTWRPSLFKKINLVIGCSKFVSDEIKSRFPWLKDRVFFVYNGADIYRFRPFWQRFQERLESRRVYKIDDKTKVVLYVGRLVPVKGVHILIKAFKQVVKCYEDVKLVIVGSHTFSENKTTQYIKNLHRLAKNNADKIIFTGYIPHNSLGKMFLLSDIAVVPSIWEDPFPLTVIEAMASGLPTVAFSKGGIPEIIKNDRSGILISESGNIPFLSNAIIYLLKNKSLRLQYGNIGRRIVEEKFSWQKITQNLNEIYEKIYNKR